MKEGPDISIIAALIGNPASANMLMALMAGPALTATELAQEAGLTLTTASGHLAKHERAGLVAVERQGRHRYFRLSDPDVAIALEALIPLAARAGHTRLRTGPRDPELRRARSCYDHLAGDLAVQMFDRFIERRLLVLRRDVLNLTQDGRSFFSIGANAEATSAERSAAPSWIGSLRWAGRFARHARGSCDSPPPASRS